jgi:hypothetical protein
MRSAVASPRGGPWRTAHLDSGAAECLVLAHLRNERISAFKPSGYTNHRGPDLIAIDANRGGACFIDVKSRAAIDYDRTFDLTTLNGADFVVLVALNRDYRYHKAPVTNDPVAGHPRMYVVPGAVAEAEVRQTGRRPRLFLSDLGGEENDYLFSWDLIRQYLAAG